jgi:hypothetical protein
MAITFDNNNNVLVYAPEESMFYARDNHDIFVAQCVCWL